MTPLFETTVTDIFNKFDIHNRKELGWTEFKSFCDVIGRKIAEADFRLRTLTRFQNTVQLYGSEDLSEGPKGGITLDGFKRWWIYELEQTDNGETILM